MGIPSRPTSDLPVIIIGAGISGLVLAQGLRLHSVPFRLYERYSQNRKLQGHRFRISQDGMASLISVLPPKLHDIFKATAPERARYAPRYVDAREFRFDAPVLATGPESMPVDRAWIRMLLTLGIEDAIEYEREFSRLDLESAGGVRASFADGSSARGCLLIGADGIGSRVRKQLQPSRKLLDLERWILWGRTVLTPEIYRQLPADALTWFMALDQDENRQVIVEPMVWNPAARENCKGILPEFQDYLYWAVASPEGAEPLPTTEEARKERLRNISSNWHPDLRRILDAASHELLSCIPVLSSKPDIELDSGLRTEEVILIGDASHPMSPMGGSGGDTAIRNAADLAHSIGKCGIERGILESCKLRMGQRAKEKIEHSFRGGQKFWRGKEWFEYR
ncbi:hypothetical protein BX600DRAFT_428543 [Xylariales sp. PMI_506]|nr:hypothetical protein BX600DRAFT_428543 [Xylariales sp. PMI_506]